MANRYGGGWNGGPGYGQEYGPRRGGYDARMRGGYDARLHKGYDRPLRGGHDRQMGGGYDRQPSGGYDAQKRGYDREWTEGMAYGREPGTGRPGTFTPFGWDPMMRWAGWDPLMGFVPYQDAPRRWSYGLAEDYRRYEHDYYRGNTAGGYGRDFRRARGYDRDSRGSDRDVRGWPRPPRG